MAEIKKGQILTPEKKDILVNQIQSELSEVADAISSGQYGQAAMDLLRKNTSKLQDVLNNLLSKKGVVTPNETDSTLDILNTSKKERLQGDYVGGIKMGTIYLVGGLLAIVGVYFLVKKYGK
jgi:vacuolar-type H+-ATPase subunit E/Vma4